MGPLRKHRHQPDHGAHQPARVLQLRDHHRRPVGPNLAVPRSESSRGSDGFTAALSNLVASYGLLAVFVLMVGESCGFPFPSEVIMPSAGLLAATGHMQGGLVAALIAGVVAYLVGSVCGYWVAVSIGGRL